MLPVLRVIEDHACSQAFLEGAIVDQVHDVARCGRWGETESVNKGPKRLHSKLETPVVVSTIEILVDDMRSITGFRERQHIKPLFQDPLLTRVWGRCGGCRCLFTSAGGTAIVSVHFRTWCPDNNDDRRRQSGAHSSKTYWKFAMSCLPLVEAIMGYESTRLNMRLVNKGTANGSGSLIKSDIDTQTEIEEITVPAIRSGIKRIEPDVRRAATFLVSTCLENRRRPALLRPAEIKVNRSRMLQVSDL